MAALTLTPTSYLILGLVGHLGRCTSYEMKRVVAGSIGYFWSFPHSQLYAEPARLAANGLLEEEQEAGGRRRRTYALTDAGREALADWLATPTHEPAEIRDLGLLKLFFGGQAHADDVQALAEAKEKGHRARLAEYEAIAASQGVRSGGDPFQLATLQVGLRYERALTDFWHDIATRGVE